MTDSNLKVLNRSQAEADARELIAIASPLLRELVNYSTWVCLRCMRTGKSTYEDMPAHLLYRHVIEMTDGIEVLVSHSCCEPAVPLIRSSLEAFLSLQYLFQDDYRTRSLSWLYCDYLEQRRREKQLDTKSSQGAELQRVLNYELKDVRMPTISPELLNYVRRSIKDPRFASIAEEYERVKKEQNGRKPPWYQLFGGPANLLELARRVKMEHFHIVEYRQWSAVLHGGNASRYVKTRPDGTLVSHQLRFAENLPLHSLHAGIFIWVATDSMLEKFRPVEPSHAKWSAEIKERLLALSKIKIDVKRL